MAGDDMKSFVVCSNKKMKAPTFFLRPIFELKERKVKGGSKIGELSK